LQAPAIHNSRADPSCFFNPRAVAGAAPPFKELVDDHFA